MQEKTVTYLRTHILPRVAVATNALTPLFIFLTLLDAKHAIVLDLSVSAIAFMLLHKVSNMLLALLAAPEIVLRDYFELLLFSIP
jgi:hypothetical protein